MKTVLASAVAVLLYLGIGAMLHAIIAGDTLAWDSAWTWGLLIGWPAFVLGLGVVASLTIALVVFVCAMLGWIE
jgi:hypothetical protein